MGTELIEYCIECPYFVDNIIPYETYYYPYCDSTGNDLHNEGLDLKSLSLLKPPKDCPLHKGVILKIK